VVYHLGMSEATKPSTNGRPDKWSKHREHVWQMRRDNPDISPKSIAETSGVPLRRVYEMLKFMPDQEGN